MNEHLHTYEHRGHNSWACIDCGKQTMMGRKNHGEQYQAGEKGFAERDLPLLQEGTGYNLRPYRSESLEGSEQGVEPYSLVSAVQPEEG